MFKNRNIYTDHTHNEIIFQFISCFKRQSIGNSTKMRFEIEQDSYLTNIEFDTEKLATQYQNCYLFSLE